MKLIISYSIEVQTACMQVHIQIIRDSNSALTKHTTIPEVAHLLLTKFAQTKLMSTNAVKCVDKKNCKTAAVCQIVLSLVQI